MKNTSFLNDHSKIIGAALTVETRLLGVDSTDLPSKSLKIKLLPGVKKTFLLFNWTLISCFIAFFTRSDFPLFVSAACVDRKTY